MTELEIFQKIQKSPLFFIELMWGLTPERDNDKFVRGKHLTWQQHDILLGVEKAIVGEAPRRISVASGHGIGKSATLAWLLLWYLFSFKDCQVACTAPSSDQMFDVLWKEAAKWIGKMPPGIQSKYNWTTDHIRITENPNVWFARAKTARKEAPEALAGVHADHVMLIADEASGVEDEIFQTAEGSLTDKNTLALLISNPTRIFGYFYDSHHGDKEAWKTFQFSSLNSPIVENEYVKRILQKNGEDSDEYRIRVLGRFPRTDAMDDRGYVPLFAEYDIKECKDSPFIGTTYMGVDPSGEGANETVWVVRDNYKAKVVAKEKVSNEKSIAQKTLTLMDKYAVRSENVTIDSFGIGANVSREIALAEHYGNPRVNGLNTGDKANDEIYLNRRAELAYSLKEWIRKGGEFVAHEAWKELLTIRYRREISGKLKLMSKLDMKKMGFESPDTFDALCLTFNAQSMGGGERKARQFARTWLGYGKTRK